MSYFLAASLVKLRDEVNSLWPNRSKVSDGWIGDAAHSARKSDHNPDWGAPGRRRGVVRALDITVRGIDVDRLLRHTTNDSRVAYVIYNRRIYTHSRGWYAYNGSNPHTNHVHVSIAHTSTAENDTKTWISSVSGSTTTATASKPKPAAKPKPKPASKSIGKMASEVIAGHHGTGHENRRRSLGVSQSVYNQVRAEVNRRAGGSTARPASKSISQMATEVIQGKHGNGHANRQRSLGVNNATYAKVRAEVNRRS